MNSLASYLASLTGAAPQEGQKATSGNGTGVNGVFAALLESTGASDNGDIISSTNPLEIGQRTQDKFVVPEALRIAGGDPQLNNALTSGLGILPEDVDVEAAIIETGLPAEIQSQLSTTTSPSALQAPAGSPGIDGDDAPRTAIPTTVAPAIPGAAAPQAPSGLGQQSSRTIDPAVSAAAGRNGQAETLLQQHATRNEIAQESQTRTTGLENAVERSSDSGRVHGLQTALARTNQSPGNTNLQTPNVAYQGDDAGNAVDEALTRSANGTSAPKSEFSRSNLVPNEPRTIQRLIKTDAGQTLVRVQERVGGEAGNISSPPTLTVSVQAPAASPGPASPPTPHVPVSALAVHIAHQANNGAKRFDIRLDPPELGRIEVRLDVSRKGQVMTHLVVERAETLDLLQRDARQLERALQDAGLNTSEDGMKFSLKDQNLTQGGEKFSDDDDLSAFADGEDGESEANPDEAMPPPSRYIASTGLDIRI